MKRAAGVGGLLCAAMMCAAVDPNEVRVTARPYYPRPKTAIRVDTKLVDVGVVVRDSRGHSVAGLTRGDFEITDNGKKRAITAFSVETYKRSGAAGAATAAAPNTAPVATPSAAKSPRFVALVFDDMALNADEFMRSKAAALRFVREGFAPGDRAGVFTTSQASNLPFTEDAAEVAKAIEKVGFRQRLAEGGMCPHFSPYDAYTIANGQDQEALAVKVGEYLSCNPRPTSGRSRRGGGGDALPPDVVREVVAQAHVMWEQIRLNSLNTMGSIRDLVDYMAKFDGKRVMLIASPGFLTGSLEQDQDDLVTRALHAGVVINSIDAKGLYTTPQIETMMGSNVRSIIHQQNLGTRPLQAASDVLGTLADSTGGIYFHNNNDLTMGFRELGMVPETSYLLAFAPDAPDGRFHRIKVKANAKGADVQFRPGYMSVEPPSQAQRDETAVEKEAEAADTIHDAPVEFHAGQGKTDDGTPGVHVVLHIDIAKLKFHEGFGLRTQRLEFVTALFDSAGNFVEGKEGELDFALSDATYQQFAGGGFNAGLTLEAKPGEYRLRGAVRELFDGKVTAGTQDVSVK